ncbi:MAG: tetratricopeptide repeat protein, partial [Terriglobales bacterium]
PREIAACLAIAIVVVAIALIIPATRARLFEWKAGLDVAAGNRAAEIADLTIALNAVAADVEALERRAQALEDSHLDEEAIGDYQQLLKMPSRELAALGRLAQIYTRTAKYKEAEDCCDQMIQLAPKSGAGYHAKARLLEQEHKLDEAMDLYGQCMSRGGAPGAMLDRENLLQKMQFRNTIEPIVEPNLLNKDNDYQALVQDAVELGSHFNNTSALAKLDKAKKLNPKRPDAYAMRVMVYTSMKKYRQAIQDFQMGERLRKEYPEHDSKSEGGVLLSANGMYSAGEVFMMAGIAYTQIGDYKNALRVFDRAIACSPSPKMYRCRSWVYKKMGDKEKAKADLISSRTAVDNYDLTDTIDAITGH